MADKILIAYREFYWFYETFLKNVEIHFEVGIKTSERIEKLYFDFREKKAYNLPHRAKIELSELQYNRNVEYDKIKVEVKKDITKLHNRIDEIINTHKLTDVNVRPYFDPFFKVAYWFWEFEKWFNDSLDSEKQNKKADQPTARQISLIFHFIKKAGHFHYPGENTKLKLFLSKISGVGVDAYKKWIPDPFKQSKEFKPKENTALANDLKIVASFLDDTGYFDAARLCRDESEKTKKSIDID